MKSGPHISISRSSLTLLISLTIPFILLAFSTHCNARTIQITGNEAKPPKIYCSKGHPTGILVDILSYVDSQMLEYEFSIQLYPWARAFLVANKCDVGIVGLSKTRSRENNFDYSDAIFIDEVILVVKKGHEFNFRSLKDLEGKTVGIGRFGTFGNDFDEAVRNGIFKIREDNGDLNRLRMLLADRIDVALISPGRCALKSILSNNDTIKRFKSNLVVLPTALKRDPNYLGFHKSMHMKKFLDEFNHELKQMRYTGILQKIISKYTLDRRD